MGTLLLLSLDGFCIPDKFEIQNSNPTNTTKESQIKILQTSKKQ
jgi:hypothetical protein